MFGLFGNSKKVDKTKEKEQNKEKAIDTINNLNKQIGELEEKIQHLEAKKNGQTQLAKEKLQKGDKSGAKQALAKKKWFDDQIKTLDGAMMMMEEQKMMLDGTMTMGNVYEALQQGSQAINVASENFKIEDLDKIRDDMEDVKATFNEKNEFFKEYSVQDDPELEDELEKLQSELDGESLPDVKEKKKEPIIVEPNNKIEANNDVKNLEEFLA